MVPDGVFNDWDKLEDVLMKQLPGSVMLVIGGVFRAVVDASLWLLS